jgi:hypothetical protein
MNATTYGPAEQSWQDPERELGGELPGRPRRKLLTPWSALLCAVILGAVGFYIGVRVEKGQLAGSTTGAASGLAARFAGATSTSSASGRSTGSTHAGGGFGGFAGGGAGGATVGTVASVNGRTVYVTETSGNTVKVTLSSATKITKARTVGRSKINPGDSVVVAGVPAAKGTVSATSLTDSGARAASSSSSSSSTSASSGSSSVSSLFGG